MMNRKNILQALKERVLLGSGYASRVKDDIGVLAKSIKTIGAALVTVAKSVSTNTNAICELQEEIEELNGMCMIMLHRQSNEFDTNLPALSMNDDTENKPN